MTLQQKLERIGSALAELIPNTYHYWRPVKQAPYCIWAEDSEDASLNASNKKQEQAISGWIDYYTKTEFDPVVDQIQTALNSFDFPFAWRYEDVQYEEDTNLIHHSWGWSVG